MQRATQFNDKNRRKLKSSNEFNRWYERYVIAQTHFSQLILFEKRFDFRPDDSM